MGQRGDSQVERKATITLGKVKTIQTKCFTFTKEMRSGLEVKPLQATLANQGVECDLIAQEVESAEYRRRMSSTYTTRVRTRGMVLHMLGGLVACTQGAVIHKVAMRRCGHRRGTEGAHQQVLMHT